MTAKNRQFITLILGLVILFSQGTGVSAQAQTYTATPSSDKTTLNGSPVTMQAYKINDNNYVKLRDFAQLVNNTPNNFEVVWDQSLNAINMYTKKAYTSVGGEAVPIGSEEKAAKDTTSAIYVNGQPVNLKGYNISNNNYFKLRDLGAALGIGIDWDSATKTVVIDSGGSAGETGKKETAEESTGPKIEVHLYDENGNEIEVPEGYNSSAAPGSIYNMIGINEDEIERPKDFHPWEDPGEIDYSANPEGTYPLTPEEEAKLQQKKEAVGSPIFARRMEAGWRSTLAPTDPYHPGWNKDGSFEVGTLRPGQLPPKGVPLGFAGTITTGEEAVAAWEGVIVNGG